MSNKKLSRKWDAQRIEGGKIKTLKLLEKTHNLSSICRSLGITNQTLWNWRDKDAIFNEAVTEGLTRIADIIEDDALVSARNKYDKKGNLEKAGNPILQMFLLKSLKKDVYGDKQVLEVSGGTELIKVIPAWIKDAEVEDQKTIEIGTESK